MEAESVAVDVAVETKSTKKGPHDKVRDIEMVESEVKTATNNWKKIRNNWKEFVDKKTGKTYYHNKATNKTSWELPQNAAAHDTNIQSAGVSRVCETKNPSFEISNKSTNNETKKETMSKKESPKTTLRRRRPTKVQNNRKIARKDSMEKRRKLDKQMAKQNDLDAADLADVNIDMRMKAVEDMYADGSANSADGKKAFCGKVFSYLMYLVIYVPAFYIVGPAFFLKGCYSCCQCGASVAKVVKNKVVAKVKGESKDSLMEDEEDELEPSTQEKDSLMEDEEDELAYNLYSPHEDKPWLPLNKGIWKCLGNLDEWQPFQQQFYEDWCKQKLRKSRLDLHVCLRELEIAPSHAIEEKHKAALLASKHFQKLNEEFLHLVATSDKFANERTCLHLMKANFFECTITFSALLTIIGMVVFFSFTDWSFDNNIWSAQRPVMGFPENYQRTSWKVAMNTTINGSSNAPTPYDWFATIGFNESIHVKVGSLPLFSGHGYKKDEEEAFNKYLDSTKTVSFSVPNGKSVNCPNTLTKESHRFDISVWNTNQMTVRRIGPKKSWSMNLSVECTIKDRYAGNTTTETLPFITTIKTLPNISSWRVQVVKDLDDPPSGNGTQCGSYNYRCKKGGWWTQRYKIRRPNLKEVSESSCDEISYYIAVNQGQSFITGTAGLELNIAESQKEALENKGCWYITGKQLKPPLLKQRPDLWNFFIPLLTYMGFIWLMSNFISIIPANYFTSEQTCRRCTDKMMLSVFGINVLEVEGDTIQFYILLCTVPAIMVGFAMNWWYNPKYGLRCDASWTNATEGIFSCVPPTAPPEYLRKMSVGKYSEKLDQKLDQTIQESLKELCCKIENRQWDFFLLIAVVGANLAAALKFISIMFVCFLELKKQNNKLVGGDVFEAGHTDIVPKIEDCLKASKTFHRQANVRKTATLLKKRGFKLEQFVKNEGTQTGFGCSGRKCKNNALKRCGLKMKDNGKLYIIKTDEAVTTVNEEKCKKFFGDKKFDDISSSWWGRKAVKKVQSKFNAIQNEGNITSEQLISLILSHSDNYIVGELFSHTTHMLYLCNDCYHQPKESFEKLSLADYPALPGVAVAPSQARTKAIDFTKCITVEDTYEVFWLRVLDSRDAQLENTDAAVEVPGHEDKEVVSLTTLINVLEQMNTSCNSEEKRNKCLSPFLMKKTLTDHLRYYLSTVGEFHRHHRKSEIEEQNSIYKPVSLHDYCNFFWEFKGIVFHDQVIQDHWQYLSMSKPTYETEFYFIFSTFCKLLNRIQGRTKCEGKFIDKWEGEAVNNLGNKR